LRLRVNEPVRGILSQNETASHVCGGHPALLDAEFFGWLDGRPGDVVGNPAYEWYRNPVLGLPHDGVSIELATWKDVLVAEADLGNSGFGGEFFSLDGRGRPRSIRMFTRVFRASHKRPSCGYLCPMAHSWAIDQAIEYIHLQVADAASKSCIRFARSDFGFRLPF